MKHLLIGLAGAALSLAVATAAMAEPADPKLAARIDRILARTPLIDGHNDLPWEIRTRFASKLEGLDLKADTSKLPSPEDGLGLMTDIPRMRAGRMGGQFWSVWIPPSIEGPAAVQTTLEQIDLVKRLAERYPADFEMAYSADDIVRIHKAGRIAALIGVEGGNQINESLASLRQFYASGARYMTLTHAINSRWADSATANPAHGGLTPFGKQVVAEMNRLGMLVDLSHVSETTMKAALAATKAPVIFSHSGARALSDHPRNVSDEVLALVAQNHGVVMVNFAPVYVSEARARWGADRSAEQARFNSPPFGGLYIGQPEKAKAALAAWEAAHPMPPVTLAMVADHIEHVAKVCGPDCVGIGSDFDGIPNTPDGLEGVDKYPALFAELARRGWSDEALAKLAGGNVLRVMRQAEAAARTLRATTTASAATLADLDATK
ncbi:MAG: dipeptidase [Phenylobacterium sp.]